MNQLIKEQLKSIGKGLVVVTILYLTIFFFRLNLFWTFILLAGFNLALLLYSKTFKWKSYIMNVAFIGIFLVLFRLIQGRGTWTIILTIVLLVIGFVVFKWKAFIKVKQQCEATIWGKPLKEFRESKEEIPKIKIVWNKEDNVISGNKQKD